MEIQSGNLVRDAHVSPDRYRLSYTDVDVDGCRQGFSERRNAALNCWGDGEGARGVIDVSISPRLVSPR